MFFGGVGVMAIGYRKHPTSAILSILVIRLNAIPTLKTETPRRLDLWLAAGLDTTLTGPGCHRLQANQTTFSQKGPSPSKGNSNAYRDRRRGVDRDRNCWLSPPCQKWCLSITTSAPRSAVLPARSPEHRSRSSSCQHDQASAATCAAARSRRWRGCHTHAAVLSDWPAVR